MLSLHTLLLITDTRVLNLAYEYRYRYFFRKPQSHCHLQKTTNLAMCRRGDAEGSPDENAAAEVTVSTNNDREALRSSSNVSNDITQNQTNPGFRRVWRFLAWIVLDFTSVTLMTSPFLSWTPDSSTHNNGKIIPNLWKEYTFWETSWDLSMLATIRMVLGISAILRTMMDSRLVRPKTPFDLCHRNGEKKTSEELENEALEEPWKPWILRFISRPSFIAEVFGTFASLFTIAKSLARLTVELGAFNDKEPSHPVCWVAFLLTSVFSVVEVVSMDSITQTAGVYGQWKRRNHSEGGGFLRRIGSNLSVPLLSETEDTENENRNQENTGILENDVEADENAVEEGVDIRGVSEITGDTSYKAKWGDLLAMIYPDSHLVVLAFVFLVLAAGAQILIPIYTGDILTDLASAFSGDSPEMHAYEGGDLDDDGSQTPIWQIPGFVDHVLKLIISSIMCGIFSGLRGSIFTVVGGRVNIRLRMRLMDSLLSQDIGFFDVTKTGDITSRLSSDTTLVGDQVTLNVNVFLRSLIQVIGVLLFMFMLSWQLSLLAFISVPVITALSKLYGEYVRRLTKLMQKKLADGNASCEAALSSMPTVRALDGASAQLNEFEQHMDQYLSLNLRSAVAYFGYSTTVTSLPNLVTAVVLFYGGLLVRNGDLLVGDLVKFLLFLQSLSDAFASIGYIFSSLTQAVGAADKVFELMNRTPRLKNHPSVCSDSHRTSQRSMGTFKTSQQRLMGLKPTTCIGHIELQDVDLYYPARPNRKVLDKLSLTIQQGSVVALVGPSGSGKSSVMGLIQHLYEAARGSVLIDGNDVQELSPSWLSRHVAVVSQEPTLFAKSVARNIIYGMEGTPEEPSLEEIMHAAQLANAHEFIQKLPFGYDTDVGERGVQLSGGQKQRIAIARALVRHPKILLLDEATSALDAESEALVQEAIDEGEEESKMTVLIVAHRLSTVRNADTIFVIEEGKVVEEGNHHELLCNPDGAYSNLVHRQMKAQVKLESSKVQVPDVGKN